MNEVVEFYEVIIRETMVKIKKNKKGIESIGSSEKDLVRRMNKLNILERELKMNEDMLEKYLNIRYLAMHRSETHE